MTFTEAALEVLRSAGEPLHYKRITELAIERNLLSHVGKTPEVTMSSRLAMMVKKDRGQAPITKVKPGVFALRESALQDFAAAAAAAAAHDAEAAAASETSEGGAAAVEPVAAAAEPKPALPGSDVFPEEEGDDDPILAGLEQETENGDRGGRRRRRRRRRGKGGDKPEGVPLEGQPREEGAHDREPARVRSRDVGGQRQQGREPRHVAPLQQGASHQGRRAREDMAQLDWDRQPADGDLLGKDLADAVWSVLSRGDRAPHSFARVAELLVRRGRLSGVPSALAPTIAAAVRADIARAERDAEQPRFRLRAGLLWLSDWLLPKSLVRAEQDLRGAADRFGNELRRALVQKLAELPTAGFAELIATWLNAEGVTALRGVRRPGSSGNELHFAGTRKRGSEETRLAIVVLRGNRDIDREMVVDVRGALHHYGQASAGLLITTGRTTSGAREEAAMAGAVPCALFDGLALAQAMERTGIGVRRYVIAHHEIDYDLLESLGDTPEQRERRDRELWQRARLAERPDAETAAPEAGEAADERAITVPVERWDDATGDEADELPDDDADLEDANDEEPLGEPIDDDAGQDDDAPADEADDDEDESDEDR